MLTKDEIIATMSTQGLRITDQRKTLATLFSENEGYLSPKDVYEYMGKKYSGLSFDTVYRNLRVMQELGVLEQVSFEDGMKFKVSCNEHHHHHHMICLSCQKTLPISFCPMQMTDTTDQFQIVEHKFEIFGYCKECQKKNGQAEANSNGGYKQASGHTHSHGGY